MVRSILSNFFVVVFLGCWFGLTATGNTSAVGDNEYLDMDISQLMQVTVTSVSKRPQTLSDAAAAVYVITQEAIHKSGVTSIPEALRMAPGIQVARISSSKWAVSSRGFNGAFSNKLLILIDGRTVYTPAFSGTYWDVQHTLLEDVDRIEVIRGPGATLWGANAVNGVINIITKHADDTIGGYVEAGIGNHEEGIGGFRFGSELNKTTKGRVYLTYNQRDSFSVLEDGADANDHWEGVTAGFKINGEPGSKSNWTLQGDVYKFEENQIVEPFFSTNPPSNEPDYGSIDAVGWNLLGKWEQKINEDSVLTIQTYIDAADREEVYIEQDHYTFDLEVQYDTWLGKRNNVTMGLGYRYIDSSFHDTFMLGVDPLDQDYDLYSGFIQDVITIVDDKLWLTVGTKWEHNDFTGNELQPTGRLMYHPNKKTALWGSVSRAVRTPSQFEDNGRIVVRVEPTLPPFPALFTINGNEDLEAEEVIAYEAGYRWFPTNNFSLDIALFYNEYDKVLGAQLIEDTILPYDIEFNNGVKGNTYGFEFVADWRPKQWFDIEFSYSYLMLDFQPRDITTQQELAVINSNSAPQHQFSLRSSIDFLEHWQANIWLRYVDELPVASSTALSLGAVVDDYFECDLNLSWKPREDLEIKLVGQNLFDSQHLEFISEFLMMPVEVERNVYLMMMYHF